MLDLQTEVTPPKSPREVKDTTMALQNLGVLSAWLTTPPPQPTVQLMGSWKTRAREPSALSRDEEKPRRAKLLLEKMERGLLLIQHQD